jgi:hypothetical protein
MRHPPIRLGYVSTREGQDQGPSDVPVKSMNGLYVLKITARSTTSNGHHLTQSSESSRAFEAEWLRAAAGKGRLTGRSPGVEFAGDTLKCHGTEMTGAHEWT